MLRALGIRDFVIAERVELETGPGFTVLSGETGAGKSILVDAIELRVGGRGVAAAVREGAQRAELAAEFEIGATGALADWLAARELEGDPGILILRRSIDHDGRSRSFINGHPATLAQLREAGEWQRKGWDSRLRRSESYAEKWAYVRENPVRRGLVNRPEDWPYQGRLNVLPW